MYCDMDWESLQLWGGGGVRCATDKEKGEKYFFFKTSQAFFSQERTEHKFQE